MKLSESDKKLLAKVRRNRDMWRRRRWVILGVNTLCAIVSFVAWLIQLQNLMAPETFADAMLWQSVLMVVTVVFGMNVSSTISRWENPTRDLLLSLIDSQDDHAA